jgi:hypothetical protein
MAAFPGLSWKAEAWFPGGEGLLGVRVSFVPATPSGPTSIWTKIARLSTLRSSSVLSRYASWMLSSRFRASSSSLRRSY